MELHGSAFHICRSRQRKDECMERLTEWLPAGTAANVKYPEGADAVIKSAYKQKAFDRLAAYEDTGLTPTDIARLTRDNATLRNELCERCGLYKEAHNGACDWCRWHKKGED